MIGKWSSSLVIGLVIATLAGCPSGGDSSGGEAKKEGGAAGGGNAEAGKQQFTTICATCHGTTGEGIQGLGKALTKSEYVAKHSDEELAKLIEEGRPADHPENTTKVAMPPKGGSPGLTAQDVADIVAYLRTLQ